MCGRSSPELSRAPAIYLANHSLGRPLDLMAADVAEFARTWYEHMDQAWDTWQAETASLHGQRRTAHRRRRRGR